MIGDVVQAAGAGTDGEAFNGRGEEDMGDLQRSTGRCWRVADRSMIARMSDAGEHPFCRDSETTDNVTGSDFFATDRGGLRRAW